MPNRKLQNFQIGNDKYNQEQFCTLYILILDISETQVSSKDQVLQSVSHKVYAASSHVDCAKNRALSNSSMRRGRSE